MTDQDSFQQWGQIELFGHQRIAGLVSEQTIGGCAFIRVDVPAVDGASGFTKLFGQGAIYAITFVTEEVARLAAKAYRVAPINPYDIPELRQLRLPIGERDLAEDGDEDIPY
jgi:hypothetical protein